MKIYYGIKYMMMVQRWCYAYPEGICEFIHSQGDMQPFLAIFLHKWKDEVE